MNVRKWQYTYFKKFYSLMESQFFILNRLTTLKPSSVAVMKIQNFIE